VTSNSHGVANENSPRRQPWEQLSNELSRVAAEENAPAIFLSLLPELVLLGTLTHSSRCGLFSHAAPQLQSDKITEPAARGGVGGRSSSGSRRRRWCRQKEMAASAIQRGRRKRPRWLCRRRSQKQIYFFIKSFTVLAHSHNLAMAFSRESKPTTESHIRYELPLPVGPNFNASIALDCCGSDKSSEYK
jgi:hypothetical protein